MGIVHYHHNHQSFARRGPGAGHRGQRQARDDLRHLRNLRTDRRFAVVLVGGRSRRKHHENLFIKAGTYVQGPPVVKYRGIFINDEAPAFSGWTSAKFGGANRGVYTNMFELLLRLRANYLWPAMWTTPSTKTTPQPRARRRIRHCHGHFAPRTDDARPAGMDETSQCNTATANGITSPTRRV